MTNLPPEHRSDDSEEPEEEQTGSFPVAGGGESMPLPPISQEGYIPPEKRQSSTTSSHHPLGLSGPQLPPVPGLMSEHQRPPAPEHSSKRQQPPAPEHSSRRQPPPAPQGYTPDPSATGQFPAFVDSTEAPSPEPQDPPVPRQQAERFYTEPLAPNFPQTREVPQIAARLPQQRPGNGESEPTAMASAAIVPPPLPRPSRVAEEIAETGSHVATDGPSDIEEYLETDDADLPARVRRRLAKTSQGDGKLQRLRSEQDSDSGWTYLAVMGLVFVLLVAFSWGCSRLSDADLSAARNPSLSGQLTIGVEVVGDKVSVSGTLPDEDKVDSLMSVLSQHYEKDNILNGLLVDSAVSLDDSAIQLSGRAAEDDERPAALAASLSDDFNVPVTASSVVLGPLPENLVDVEVVVKGRSAVISGNVPDQAKLDLVKGAAESVWGTVDVAGLVIEDVEWSGGNITVGGDLLGSAGPQKFADQVKIEGIFVDPGTTPEDLDGATPDQIKEAITEQLAVNPIQFEGGKTGLSAEAKQTLDSIAPLLGRLPEDQAVTIEGFGGDDKELGNSRASLAWSHLTNKGVSNTVEYVGKTGDAPSQIGVVFK